MKKLKAGTYVIGDPCYLFDESWVDILVENNFFETDNPKIDGKDIFVHRTYYGDGTYKDDDSFCYDVDAGLIGVLPIELIEIDNAVSREDVDYQMNVRVVIFKNDFICDYKDGVFFIDNIRIDTK
jgi:hypothetical protein